MADSFLVLVPHKTLHGTISILVTHDAAASMGLALLDTGFVQIGLDQMLGAEAGEWVLARVLPC